MSGACGVGSIVSDCAVGTIESGGWVGSSSCWSVGGKSNMVCATL